MLNRLFEGVSKRRPVGEVGQRVVAGLMRDLLLELFPIRDVTDVDHQPLDARQIEEVRDRHLAVRPGTELVAQPAGDRSRVRGGLQRIVQTVQQSRSVGNVGEVDEARSHQLTRGKGEQTLHGCALKADDAVAVGERGGVRRVFDQRPQVLLTPLQGRRLLLQSFVETGVVEKHHELADHHQHDDDHDVVEQESVDGTGKYGIGARRQYGDRHWNVGEEELPEALGLLFRLRRVDRDQPAAKAGQRDEQIAGHPPGVDGLCRPVRIHSRQVCESTVGEEVSE